MENKVDKDVSSIASLEEREFLEWVSRSDLFYDHDRITHKLEETLLEMM